MKQSVSFIKLFAIRKLTCCSETWSDFSNNEWLFELSCIHTHQLYSVFKNALYRVSWTRIQPAVFTPNQLWSSRKQHGGDSSSIVFVLFTSACPPSACQRDLENCKFHKAFCFHISVPINVRIVIILTLLVLYSWAIFERLAPTSHYQDQVSDWVAAIKRQIVQPVEHSALGSINTWFVHIAHDRTAFQARNSALCAIA